MKYTQNMNENRDFTQNEASDFANMCAKKIFTEHKYAIYMKILNFFYIDA